MMDGPERVRDRMEMQGAELYPHATARLTDWLAAELHSKAKPEKLRKDNRHRTHHT